jgi:hypothetical protein
MDVRQVVKSLHTDCGWGVGVVLKNHVVVLTEQMV